MFERAYRRFREHLEELAELAYWLRWHMLRLSVNLTLPVWIVPYAIWRRIRRNKR